ncbi:MAG: hypothetical protein ACK4F9_00405 [Brevinematia bacterium]
MRKLFLIVVGFVLMQGCGLAIKETRQELDSLSISDTYRLGIKYYSEGFVNEAEFIYKEALYKYYKLENPTDEDRRSYLWCLYEIAFINYIKNNFGASQEYLDKLFQEAGSFGDRLPQVVLGKKLALKMKYSKR